MMDEDTDGHPSTSDFDLTSFMFGNINESGQLENDDFLDNNTKKYLTSLSKLGFGSVVSEVIVSSDYENYQDETNSPSEKSPTAQDFFDIDELVEENAAFEHQAPESESGYDGDNEHSDRKPDKFKRLETPLAAMLPSKYENVDVTTLFPDFRVGKVILIH